jgi:methylmalonyl-CoA mutase N-terminal domain/subunit
LKEVKGARDNRRVTQILNDLRAASKTDKNLMPYVIEAVKEYTTEQEICDVWRDIFGEYRDPGFY